MDGERNSAPGEGAGKAREIELRTEKMAFGGQALGRVNRFVVFVDDALPGELVRARVYKKKKDFAFARAVEVLEASPDRVAPGCAWSGNCGGYSRARRLRW